MLIAARISTVALLLIGVIEFIVIQKRRNIRAYEKCVFFSVSCEFFSMLYYLALSTDPTLENTFTVGIFGELAQILFIITANTHYIPKTDGEKNGFSVLGLIFAILSVLPLFATFLFDSSAQNIVSEILYIVTVSPCVYFCVANIKIKTKNSFMHAVSGYNLLTCVYFLFSVVSQPLLYIAIANENTALFDFGFCVPVIIMAAIQLSAVWVLERGLNKWEKQ